MKIYRIEMNEQEAKATLGAIDTVLELETNDPTWYIDSDLGNHKVVKRVAFLGSAYSKIENARIEEYPKS